MHIPARPHHPVRRFWRRYRALVCFLLGLIALDGAVALQRDRWRRYDPDEYAIKVAACRRAAPDLLVIGGSPVSEGIDPGELAGVHWRGRPLRQAFNLGLPGGTTSEFWHAVRHGVRTPPRLLVYGITASDLNDTRQEPHGPDTLMSWRDLASWVRTRPHSAGWVARHFVCGRLVRLWQLYRHRNAIRLWLADAAERRRPGSFPHAAAEARHNLTYSAELARPDGFAPNPDFRDRRLDEQKAAGLRLERFHFLERYRVGDHLLYLHRLLDWADARGVSVVLVDMPVSADLQDGLHAEAFAIYRAALAEIERQRGVPVLRAHRTAVGLTDADFADFIHLNAHGAARLSSWVREQIDERFGTLAGR